MTFATNDKVTASLGAQAISRKEDAITDELTLLSIPKSSRVGRGCTPVNPVRQLKGNTPGLGDGIAHLACKTAGKRIVANNEPLNVDEAPCASNKVVTNNRAIGNGTQGGESMAKHTMKKGTKVRLQLGEASIGGRRRTAILDIPLDCDGGWRLSRSLDPRNENGLYWNEDALEEVK